MRTTTVKTTEFFEAREETTAVYRLDPGKMIQRLQNYIETSDWDRRFIHYAAGFDNIFLSIVILLAGTFFLTFWLAF